MIHHVFANRSNVGDWLSAKGIQSLLAPEPVTEYLCDEPFVPETLRRLDRLTERDLIVIGGGGLFMDYFVPFWEGFLPIARRVPFCIWGVGYCRMKREDSLPPASLIEEIVRLSRLCVVRDQLSRNSLGACEIEPPVPCPSISMVSPLPLGNGVLHVDAWDNVGEANYEAMEAAGKAFASATGRSYHSINNLIPAGDERALSSVLSAYAESAMIISGRLHGCIIGLAMGRPVLAVSGDHKIESFMHAAGLGKNVLDLNQAGELSGNLRSPVPADVASAFLNQARIEHRRIARQVKSVNRSGS